MCALTAAALSVNTGGRTGSRRSLTFEVPGGGFSWFGNAPANKILTAYGLMEFSDMSKVYDIDPKITSRTQQWLAGQQQADGSWKPDASFINEGATNRFNKDQLRITAYVAWSLENTGYQGPAVERPGSTSRTTWARRRMLTHWLSLPILRLITEKTVSYSAD